jgi:hypothetical protein
MSYESMREDIQGIIKTHGQQGHLVREEESTDSLGYTELVGGKGYTLFLIIQDITNKDRQIHEMGLAIPGNVKAFFYNEYPDSITGNGVLIIKAGDKIMDKYGKWWRVEQILGSRKASTKEIFRVGILKRIDIS